jgi:hypothetical protein
MAPDRPEDLNPTEPNDELRAQIIRFLDAADAAGIPIGSVNAGVDRTWFVRGAVGSPHYSLEQGKALAGALDDAAHVDLESSTRETDWLCVSLSQPAGSPGAAPLIRIEVEKQVGQGDLVEAAVTISRLANWPVSADWMDPGDVAEAYRAALARVTSPAALVELGVAAKALGVTA